jgi:16S rRNA (cytosine967-C5)-methyltransferase
VTPAARVQAAIEIVEGLGTTAQAADKFIRDWFSARRFAGSKDRAAVTGRVYAVLRHRASAAWRMGNDAPRALVIGSLLNEGVAVDDVAELFGTSTYAPPALTDDERAVIARDPGVPPPHVLGEYPEWLEPELKRQFDSISSCATASLLERSRLADEMAAFNTRATVDLRVNTLRAARDDMLTGLRSLDVKAERTPFSQFGIRVPSGERLSTLEQTQLFQTGAFEFQDEASQVAAILCGAKPGMRVLDLCAGAGGKSLALAAIMQDKGHILAFDDEGQRLKPVRPRARRAGATIIGVTEKRGGHHWGNGRFDVVLVDAPCSGSGTWRRNPELKWRLTPERLEAVAGVQSWLLADGARHTQPGGRLVYATCSILPRENEDQVDAFLAAHPDFHAIDAADVWREATNTDPPPGMARYFHASPHTTQTDGFFAAVMVRG